MKQKTMVLGLIFGLFFSTSIFAQDTQYAYGIVNGNAMVNGEFNIFMYYTKIDKVNCYVSRTDAENQLKEAFESVAKNWDKARFTVNFFDSYDEAENFKNSNVQKTRSTASRSRMTSITIADQNVPFDFNCSN